MFDISWSEFLILGVVVLVFVGPKELPVFLRTMGRYTGVLRRHAQDFRAQFDEAMREAEVDGFRREAEKFNRDLMRESPLKSSASTPAQPSLNPEGDRKDVVAGGVPATSHGNGPATRPEA